MAQDIFEFWSQIGYGERIHPADKAVFDRLLPGKHGFRLDALPACFAGRLRDAPVVMLYLSPGFRENDVADARSKAGKDYYSRRYTGYELPRDAGTTHSPWFTKRTKAFGEWAKIKSKIALLNIGAYHSVNVKSIRLMMALPSSRVSLDWAQQVLFPQAEAGDRIVICMRSANLWGLECGRKYRGLLFAPEVNRSGYLLDNPSNRRLIQLVRERM